MAPFQIHFKCMPHMIPLLPGATGNEEASNVCAHSIVAEITDIMAKAQDALLVTKINQAAMANKQCMVEIPYNLGNLVMLSTDNHQCNLKRNN